MNRSRLTELWPAITRDQRNRLKVLTAEYFALKKELEQQMDVDDDEPSRPSSLVREAS